MQLAPWFTLDPWEQAGLAPFEMPLGAEHALGEQVNVDGDRVPALQLKASLFDV